MKILEKKFDRYDTISISSYNKCISFLIVFGLLLNLIMCLVCKSVLPYINTVGFCIGYFIMSFVAMMILTRTENKFLMMLSYFLIVVPTGFLLSSVLNSYSYDSNIVIIALLLTLFITICISILSLLNPDVFLRMRKILMIGLISLIIVSFISIIFNFSIPCISLISAALFSMLIGYDVVKAQSVPKTFKNAVFSAINIYLDLINLFLDVFNILNKDN